MAELERNQPRKGSNRSGGGGHRGGGGKGGERSPHADTSPGPDSQSVRQAQQAGEQRRRSAVKKDEPVSTGRVGSDNSLNTGSGGNRKR